MIAQLPRGHLAPILVALLLGTLMTAMSQLIVTTALPTVVASLGGLDLYSWVFAVALLASTVVYPIAGKLSDLYGRRTVYLVGMVIFMLGSALSGASQSILQLIIFRAVQGVGAGCVQPTVAALLADLFPVDQRAKWQGANGAIWAIASALGPVLGGYLAEHASWRWVFYINLIPGVIALALMVRYLPARLVPTQRASIDLRGIALLSGALMCLVLITLWGGKSMAWTSVPIFGLIVATGVLFAAFIAHERVTPEPVVPPQLFRNRSYQTTIMLVFLSGVGMYAGTTYVPLYLQGVFGISATSSGLMFLPTILITAGLSVMTGFFMARIGYRRLAFLTMLAAAVGFGYMAIAGPEAGVLPSVIGISVVASALGLSFPVYLIIGQVSAEQSMLGVATSLIQLTRSLGGTIGVAALGALMTSRLTDVLGARQELTQLLRPEALTQLSAAQTALLRLELSDALRAVFAIGAVAMIVATVLTLRLEEIAVQPRRMRRRAEPEASPVPQA